MLRDPRAHWLVLLGLTTLIGCRPLLEVRLASDNERLPAPKFTIEDPSRKGGDLRYASIAVVEDSNLMSQWMVFNQGEVGPSLVAYGETPVGFEERTAPQPLLEGRKYGMSVRAIGNEGSLHFIVEPGGAVRKDPAYR